MNFLLLGTILRIFFALISSHYYDVEVWYITSVNMLSGSITPYNTMYFSYPPMWPYFQLPFLTILSFFINPNSLAQNIIISGELLTITHPLFNLFSKFPIIIVEILLGLLIYDFVSKTKDERSAKTAFKFWFLNPLVIFIGSIIGQIDALAALVTIIGFFLIFKKSYFFAGFSLGLGIMTKIYPIFFFPAYIIFSIKLDYPKEQKRNLILSFLKNFICIISGILFAIFITIIPLLINDGIPQFFESVLTQAGYFNSLGGLSIFNIFYLFDITSGLNWINEYGRASVISQISLITNAIAVALISIYYTFYSQKTKVEKFLQIHIKVLIVVLSTSMVVNPQYIMWIMPFLIIYSSLYDNCKLRLSIISILGVIFGLYWAFPFYPLTFYSGFQDIFQIFLGIYYFYQENGYMIMALSGLISGLIIISFFIPNIEFIDRPIKRISHKISTLIGRYRHD